MNPGIGSGHSPVLNSNPFSHRVKMFIGGKTKDAASKPATNLSRAECAWTGISNCYESIDRATADFEVVAKAGVRLTDKDRKSVV